MARKDLRFPGGQRKFPPASARHQPDLFVPLKEPKAMLGRMESKHLAGLVMLALTACAVSADPTPDAVAVHDGGPGPSPPAADAAAGADAAPADPDASMGGISGGGTGFTTAHQMFDWVNQTRQQYSNHIPYDGYPFQGQNMASMTWSTILTWDDALAATAQNEAERLAAGGAPQGTYFGFQNDGAGEGFYTMGLDSPAYFVASRADGSLPQFVDVYGVKEPPHHFCVVANGMYRMGVAYQTGSGSYSHKTKLGVGAAEGGTNVTWWVLVFGE
jgi:hypothetical protein